MDSKASGRGSCPNSPHSSDRTQLSRGGEGTLDKTVKQRLGFVYLICLTQFPGPTGTGSELGDGVRKGAWFPSLSPRLSQTSSHFRRVPRPRVPILQATDPSWSPGPEHVFTLSETRFPSPHEACHQSEYHTEV